MLNYSANGPSGYNLTNSLRFRSSASAFLSRTPASASNRKTWTWSGWVKRGDLSALASVIFMTRGSDTDATYLRFGFDFAAANCLSISSWNNTTLALTTTQVFRDPSSWYHIVLAFDTTQATASNRVKIYVNGNQVTAFSTATYPSQNSDFGINNNTETYIGRLAGVTNYYFDGYMDEINFIDGQALSPSSFGSTNATTGVWQPARYTGTYGTNGFYLNFTDIALTSGSNAGLGKDFSGNGNYWNTNNISVTSGVTYDAMKDVPTLTSATVANYCVLSPLAGDVAPTNGNLYVTGVDKSTLGTVGVSSGKWYFEMTCVSNVATTNNDGVGIGNCGVNNSAPDKAFYIYRSSGVKLQNGGSNTAYGASFTTGDVIGVAYDADAGTLVFYKNNSSQGTAFTGITGTMLPIVYARGITSTPTLALNFGQQPFTYTPPTGYVALNTFNLPTSTIVKGNTVMDATAYTGTNGSPTTQVISSNFQPDFLWFKKRSASYDHALIDTNRGITKQLYSNLMNAEGTDSDVLTAIGASSFTVGNSNYSNYGTLVAWTWKANAGSTSSNTQGSITSTVQANTTAGFSIITYTGNGVPNATVGHGLGVQPNLIIVKQRTGTADNWAVSVKLSNLTVNRMYLNSNIADNGTDWIGASSTLLTLKLSDNFVNANGNTYVSYCWASIEGFSRIGSYTGNGSSDGTFVYTGFRPKYIMIKSSSIAGEWAIYDVPRDLYNPMGLGGGRLQANTSNAETGADSAQYIDFLSNGFKIRNTSGFDNQSGATYIFAAFASNPFKNSLAF